MSPSKKILSQNGEPMLSARKVADRLKCAPDYVSKLCRDGKLQGEQIEGQWFVPQSSIAAFEESRALAKEQRAQELGQQRRSENLEYKIHHAPFPTRVLARAQTFAAGSTIGAVAGVVMLVGAAVFASTMHAPKTTSLAAVSQAESAFFGTQPPAVKISAGEALQNASGFLSGVFATLFGSDSASPSAGSNIADGGAPQGDGPRTEQIPSKESAYPESADVAKSSGPTTVVQNTYPVIERTVVREVASGGVSEEYVSLRLQDLYNRLAVQISDLQNPGRESPHQNFAVSQVINNLSDVRLNNVTTADDINADFVNTSRLDVSGQANFAAGITAATTTLSSLVVPGTSTLGSTTVTNLAVTNLSTSTFAGSLQTTGALAVGGNQYSAFKLSVNGLAYIGDPTEPYPGLVPGDELEAQLVIRRDTAAATVVLRNMDATTEAAGIIAFANSSDDQDGKIQLNGTAATTLSGSRSFNLMSNFGDIGFWRDYSGGGTPVNTLTIKGTSAGSTAGFVGIGTSSPAVNLAVQGNGLVSGTFTAGSIVATSSFTLGGNATINGGFAAYASSTIGNGNQNAGLTVFGGATTTGNAYFAGGVGIGIATSTAGVLQTSGNAYIGGNLTVVGNSVTLGASSANTLSVVSSLTSNLTPNQNITYDLGSPSFYWRNAYIGTLNANNISAANTQISGTQSADFTVNSDNVSADAEDANLIFFRGNVVPNAVLGWNSTDKRFTLNQSTFIQNASTNNLAGVTLDLKGQSGQTGALFNVASSSATSYFHITSAGRVGIGTTTPATSLDIYATDALHIPTGTTAQRPSMNFAGQVRYNTTTHQFEGYGDNNVWQGLGGVIDADQDTYITADTGNADEDFLRFFTAGSQRLTISNLGLVTVASGFLSQASSTIGAGTQTTGLTVFGGATTTGNAYVAGTVGIGTATPTDKLQVSGGDIGITGSGANLSFRGPQAANVGHQGFFDLNLITNGVSRITVKDGGNVGVGSSTPWGLLSVNANVLGSGAPQFVVGSSTKTDLIVTSAGLVGIGTTTPLNTLDVSSSGTAKVQIYSTSNTGASSVQVQNTDGDNAEYLQYGRSAGSTYFGLSRAGLAVLGGSPQSAMAVGTRTSTPLVFATNNVEVARFSSAGNFGVGTTSPTARLDVAGSNNGTSPLLQVSSVASFATTTRLLVDSSGNVGISTTSPAQTLAVGGTGYFSGNVGIGGTNSSSRLHVANINSSTFSGSNSATWNSVATVQNTTNATGANALINLYTGGGNVNTVFGVVQNASGRGDLVWGAYQGSSVFAENMRLTDQGNLGIGTTTPAQTLSVQGNQYTSGTAFFGGAITATSTLSLSGLGTLASGFVSQASSTVVGNFKTAGITNMDGLNVMFNPTGLSGGGGPWAGTYDFQADSSYSLNRTSLGIVPPVGKTVADLRVYNGADVLNSGLMQFGYDDRGFWQVATNYNGSGTARSLHLHAAASPMSGSEINKQFVLLPTGYIGIGTDSPQSNFSITGSSGVPGNAGIFEITTGTGASTDDKLVAGVVDGSYAWLQAVDPGNAFRNLVLNPSGGSVGIGTTSPQATLGIQGSVGVNSTQLILNANGSVGVGGAGGGAKFTINGNGGTSSHGQLDISNTAFSANVASIGIESASNSIVNGGALGDFSIASPANLILGTSNGGMVKINNASTAQAQFYGWSQLSTDSRDGALFLGSAAQFRGVLQYGVGAATPILSLDNTYDDVGAAIQFRTRTSGSSTTTVMTLTGNGNVGIGTTSPRARLDVAGANNGTAPLFQVSSVSSFATTTRLIIDSSGNVGIGTTSPYAKLSMGSVSTGTGIALDPADSGIVLASYNSSASNAQQLVIKHALGLVDISNVRGNALTMQTSGGNLGVGTTSPLARLSVTGTGASTGLTFQTTNSSNVPMFTVMDQGNVGVGTASPFSGYSLGTYERVVGLSSTVDNSMVGFGMNVTEGSSNRRAAWFLDDSTGTWGMRGTASSGGVGDFLLTTGFNTEGFRVTNGSASASGGVGQNIKVGVSSSTPYAKLAVHANDGETTRALFAIGSSTASATTTLFVVTNTGAVGIATSAPEKPLDVWGTSGQLQVGRTSVGAWYTNITNNALMSSMFGELQFTPSGAQGSNTSAFEVTNSSGTVQHAFLTTGVSYFAGNMGIATTSPYARLSVKGAGNSGATTPVQITDSSDRSLFSISDQGTIASVFRGTLGAATSSIGGPINLGATLSSANYLDGIPNSQVFITASGATNSDTLTLGNTGATSPGAGINFQSGLTGVDSRLRTAGHIYSGNTAGGYSSTYLTLGTASAFSTYRDELTLKTGSVGVGSTTPYARLSVDTTTLGSTNAFVVGSSTVTDFIVTNGGRVGVGSSAAAIGAAKMYVNGTGTNGLVVDTTDTTNAFSLLVGGSYKWTQFVASNDLNFYDQTGGASRLTLQDTSGFVGIGNTSPGEILDIALAQNATSSLKLRNSNSSSNASARFVLGNNSDAQDAFFQLNSSANTSYGGARSLNIVANAGSIAFTNGYLNPSPSMLITSAGLVGIGTTTPGSLLSLGSIANFTTATTTFYSSGGINLTGGGCFAVAGTCIGSQNGILAVYATSTVGTTTVNFNGAVNSSPSFSAGVLTLPSNTSYVTVEVWGAGGGGAGANSTTGASGGMTCFGTNATACSSPTLSATGGTGGSGNGAGGAGGSGSGGDVNLTGGGGGGGGTTLTNTFFPGGTGGVSPLGGTNGSTNYAGNSNGSAFGGGGSGGGVNNNAIQAPSGSGGGAGGYSSKLILSLNSSYKFAVGAGGAGTANGATGGSDGGNGGAGGVKITVYTTSNTNIGTGSTQQPTQTALTSGSGTYNVPAGTSYIRVRMVGAGGGGGGATGSGTSGGTSSFGSFTAVGGTFGVASGAGGAGGTGGSGTANLRIPGGRGGTSVNSDTHSQSTGGSGGSTAFGSAQGMTANTTDGSTGVTNTGSGGSGSGGDMLVYGSGSGGGGGEYVELLVTSPSASYSYAVGAGGSGGAGTKVGGAGAAGMIIIDEYYGSSSNISSSGVISSGTAGQFGFFQSNGTTLTGTSTLFLTTSGNIGIGTTTPTSNFVVSSVNQQAGTSALLTVASTTGTSLFSVFGNGSVSIGTTSSQFPLTIYNATNPTLLTTNSNGGGFQLRFQNYAVTNGHYFQVGPSDSNNNFAIFNQSNVGMYLADGGTSWSNTSDQRLKTNIQTLTATSGLESILRLNPVTFNWKDVNTSPETTHLGFIAQEVQEIFPELVNKSGTTTATLADGSTIEVVDTLGVDYTGLIPPLVKATQELNFKIETRTGGQSTTTVAALAAGATTTPGIIENMSSTLITAIAGVGNMVVRVFDGAISATVGIFNTVYAKEIHADLVCATKSNGEEVCIDGDQLAAVLDGTATSTPQGGDNGGGGDNNGGDNNASSTPPVITLIGADPAELNVGDVYSDLGVTIESLVSPNIGYTISLDGATSTPPNEFTLDTSSPGTHVILYSATDQNNQTGTATRTVIVTDPNI